MAAALPVFLLSNRNEYPYQTLIRTKARTSNWTQSRVGGLVKLELFPLMVKNCVNMLRLNDAV